MAKRIHRKTERSVEEQARLHQIREQFQQKKPSLADLAASGEYNEPIPHGDYLLVRQLAVALKKAREEAGLSLADVEARSGIDKAALSRLETGQHINPTLSTLNRYAHAVGKKWVWALESLGAGERSHEAEENGEARSASQRPSRSQS